jgi:hypothetical protein
MAITRSQQARQMLNNAGAVEQDGSLNFIKNSESVTVPKEFKARENAPATKLAYITAAEAKMLKKLKKGTPHKGPKGIPSYDSFGSIDSSGKDTGRAGGEVSAAESGDIGAFGRDPGAMREAQDFRSAAIAAGAGQRVNPGFFDSRNVVSPAELRAAKAFAPSAFAKTRGGLMNFISGGGLLGNVVRGLGQRLGFGKRFNQPTYDMSQFNQLGLMGQVPEDFEDEKISLESFISPEDTIGTVNLNDLEGLSALDFIDKLNLNDYEGIVTDKGLTEVPGITLDNLDQGLTEVPGITLDQGLTEVPGITLDQGLTEVPPDFIDQGITTALSKNNIPVRLASALTTPTTGKLGLNLIDYSKLRNNRYNDSQIKEAIEGGYVNDLLKTLSLATGGRVNAMDGGIMDLKTGRQMYGLGKLVKKATRAIKKVVKSPVGKAALGLAAFKFGPAFLSGKGFGLGKAKTFSDLSFFGKNANVNLARLIGVPSLLAGLTAPKQEDEEIDIAELYGSGVIDPNAQLTKRILGTQFAANGGRIGYAEGSKEPVAKKVMPLLDMGGMEKDYRADGGFVPIGRMEKADDVPARLSKNEFVFTADAVRNAGEGDVDKGAEVMYNMMKNLESGGEVSKESQGLKGAREMFQTSQRLGEVI